MCPRMSAWEHTDPTAIALIYVACARLGDGELVEAELVRIVERVGQWMPGASEDQLREVIARGIEQFQAAPDERTQLQLVEASAERLHEVLAAQDRERVVTELIGLVQADGAVDVGETDFVLAVARALGVEVALV